MSITVLCDITSLYGIFFNADKHKNLMEHPLPIGTMGFCASYCFLLWRFQELFYDYSYNWFLFFKLCLKKCCLDILFKHYEMLQDVVISNTPIWPVFIQSWHVGCAEPLASYMISLPQLFTSNLHWDDKLIDISNNNNGMVPKHASVMYQLYSDEVANRKRTC